MTWFPRRGQNWRERIGFMEFARFPKRDAGECGIEFAENGRSPVRAGERLLPCFGPEEESGHDSRGRKATLSSKLEMIRKY